jgi:hypothetical protein
MPIHKLAEGPLTITVVNVAKLEGKYGPQLRFSGDDGTDVYVNELPATKQLARLSLTPESVIGRTIHLEQVKKDGTTFTNMSLASAGAVTGPSYAAPAPAPKMSVPEIGAVYAQCVDQAIATLGAKLEEAGLAVTPEAIQSAAATMFIRAMR